LLVIDDEPGLVRLVRRHAERHGIDTFHAETGLAGFQAALSHHPDLILLDLHLPDVYGLTLLRQLKADPRTAHIPVVAWSGADATNMSRQAIGATAYFDKTNLKEVVEKLFAFITNARGR